MIRFFYNMAPNPMKVALFLEEAGLPYEAVAVDTRKGDQHAPAFRAINPNGKVPAIIDGDAVVFDSNAILLYLAGKTGQFLPPAGDKSRGELLSWLMFVASGVGPFSGQAVHFRNFAPAREPYALKRYDFEARRHWQIVDDRLAKGRWMLGDTYTIVDMAVWGWGSRLTYMLGDDRIITAGGIAGVVPYALEEPEVVDLGTVLDALLGNIAIQPAFDVNGDTEVNIADVVTLINEPL